MNAGDQLIFDFNTTTGTYDDPTDNPANTTNTTANEVTFVDIQLFNFGSEKSGDELFITVITTSGRETILLTDDSFYNADLQYTVTSSTGDPIIGIEFLAGNESSFKLGIAGIGSISYDQNFQMDFAYDITDVDGDTDSGFTTVQIGNGTLNTDLDYNTDSNIVYDSTDVTINGGTGIDTLVLDSGIDIDFSSYSNDINNIEEIDMTNSSASNDLSNISADDILSITDSNNLLTILGDSGDNVNFTGTWNYQGTSGGFITYTSTATDNSTVTVKIEDTVSII